MDSPGKDKNTQTEVVKRMAEDDDRNTAYGTRNSIQFRQSQAEHTLRELEKFSDELRLSKMLHEEQIKTLKEQHSNVDSQLKEMRASDASVGKLIDDRITRLESNLVELKLTLISRVADVERLLSTQFNDNKTYFQRWFLGIVVGLVVAVVVIIVSRIITNGMW